MKSLNKGQMDAILGHLKEACRLAAEGGVDLLGPNVARNMAVARELGHTPLFSRYDGDGDGRDDAHPERIFEYQVSNDGERWQFGNLPMKPQASRAAAERRLKDRIAAAHEFIFVAFRPAHQGGLPLEITRIFHVAPEAVLDELNRQLKQVKASTSRLNFTINVGQLLRMVRGNKAVEGAVNGKGDVNVG